MNVETKTAEEFSSKSIEAHEQCEMTRIAKGEKKEDFKDLYWDGVFDPKAVRQQV